MRVGRPRSQEATSLSACQEHQAYGHYSYLQVGIDPF